MLSNRIGISKTKRGPDSWCVDVSPENLPHRKERTRSLQKSIICSNRCSECSLPKKTTVSTDPLEKNRDDNKYKLNFRKRRKVNFISFTNMTRELTPTITNGKKIKNCKRKKDKMQDEPKLIKYTHFDEFGAKPHEQYKSSAEQSKRVRSPGGVYTCTYSPHCKCLDKNVHNSQAQTLPAPGKINRGTNNKQYTKERQKRIEVSKNIEMARGRQKYDMKWKNSIPDSKHIPKVVKNTIESRNPKPRNRMTCFCDGPAKNNEFVENVFAEGPIRYQHYEDGIEAVQEECSSTCKNENFNLPTQRISVADRFSSTSTTSMKSKIASLYHKYSKSWFKTSRKNTDLVKHVPKVIAQNKKDENSKNEFNLVCKCYNKGHDNSGKKCNLCTNRILKNQKDQTGDPLVEIEIDAVDMCVLNTNKIREDILSLKIGEEIKPTCICPSHKKRLNSYYKNKLCKKGICQKAYQNKKTNFNCKCSHIRECTDITCEPNITQNLKEKLDLKTLSLPIKYNDPMFELKLDRNSMCVLNQNEFEKKIVRTKTQAKKKYADICPTGICTKLDSPRGFRCKCIEKKRKPEVKTVDECTNKTCKYGNIQNNKFCHDIRSKIGRKLFKNRNECTINKNCQNTVHLKNNRAQTKFKRVRKSLDINEVQNIKSILTCYCSQIMNRSENFITRFQQKRELEPDVAIEDEKNKNYRIRNKRKRKINGIKIKGYPKNLNTNFKLNQVRDKKNSMFLRIYNDPMEMKVDCKNMNCPNAQGLEDMIISERKKHQGLERNIFEQGKKRKKIKRGRKKNPTNSKKLNPECPTYDPVFEIKMDSDSMCILNPQEVEKNILEHSKQHITGDSNIQYNTDSRLFCDGEICTPRVLKDKDSCICCVCGKLQSHCKCKKKSETFKCRQIFGDSISCLLRILGIDLSHTGSGDTTKNSYKKDITTMTKKSKEDRKADKEKAAKKRANEEKSKEKNESNKKKREVEYKTKQKVEIEAKKKEQEESNAMRKEREREEAEKLKRERLEEKKKIKAANAADRKIKKEMEQKNKLESKQRIKELKEEEEEIEALHKEETSTDTNCLADLIIGILKLAAHITLGILTIIYKVVSDPKGSIFYTKKSLRDPKGTIFKLKKWFNNYWRHQKFKIMKTVKGSQTLTVLCDTFQDTALYEAFRPKGRTPKERIFIEGQNKRRKRRIIKRQNQALYGCRHALLTTLRKTPCLWVYHICPNHYPQCLSLLTFLRNFSDMMLFVLAILFWTPCIVFVECLRAILCCFMCS